MSEQMKPCPFCGGTARIRHTVGYWGYCLDDDCGAIGGDQPTEAAAIAAWNKRSMDAELQRLQDRVHWLEGQNKRLQEILDGWQVETYGDY